MNPIRTTRKSPRRVSRRLLQGAGCMLGLLMLTNGCSSLRQSRDAGIPLPPGMTRAEYRRLSAQGRQAQAAALPSRRAPVEERYRGSELAIAPVIQASGPAVIALMESAAPLSPAATNLTVALWIRCDALPTAAQSYAGLIGRYNPQSTAASEWLVGIDHTGKVFLATTGAGTVRRINAIQSIATGAWTHICGDWRPNGQATLYVNGSLQATATLQAPTPGSTALLIGDVQPADGSHYFAGCIDEIKVWTRAADTLFVANLYKAVPDADGDGIRDADDPDDNNDGIPDVWAYTYFGDRLGGTPAADPDRDGFNNLAEYIAGTDPNEKRSYFLVWGATQTNKVGALSRRGIVFECEALPGRVFQTYAAPTLKNPVWTAVGSAVTSSAAGPVFIAAPATNKLLFYQIKVRMK